MRFRPKPFLSLDFVHLATIIPLLTLLTYLLIESIQANSTLDYNNNSNLNSNSNQTSSELPTPRQLKKRSIDWIGLDQYLIEFCQLSLTIFSSIVVWTRSRKLISIAILLHLVNLIQLVLIEASDNRDFPASILRDEGYSLARYAILYTSNTTTFLVLKSTLLVLYCFNYLELIVYFVLLRYQFIYRNTTRNVIALSRLHHQNLSGSSSGKVSNRDGSGGGSAGGLGPSPANQQEITNAAPSATKAKGTTTTTKSGPEQSGKQSANKSVDKSAGSGGGTTAAGKQKTKKSNTTTTGEATTTKH